MSTLKFRGSLAFTIALVLFCGSAQAQKTVYKWIDDDGVVHFSDAPPDPDQDAPGGVEAMAIPKSPPPQAAAPPAAAPTARAAPGATDVEPDEDDDDPVLFAALELSEMSLADLDMRCEAARERKIAPLRAAAIAECQANKRNDPEWCVRFNADFGDAGRTVAGTMRPRMFDDLPECVDALQERNRRGR